MALNKEELDKGCIQRWYFRKFIATDNIFLGIDSSGGVDAAMEFIPCRNRFLLV
jgi:hypothetical protein